MLVNFKPGSAWVSKPAQLKLHLMRPEDIKEILIIRHVAIGDMVMSRPFFIALKNYFPNARVTLSLTSSYQYGAPLELVDEHHVITKTKKANGRTNYKAVDAQIKELGSYDLLFDQTDSALSIRMSRAIQAKIKIGFPHRSIRKFFYDATVLRSDMVLETETLLHQLQLLGAPLMRELEFKTKSYQADQESPYIIYFPGASADYKIWSKENYISLINMMAKQHPDIEHVILEGVSDNEKFEDIYQAVSNNTNVSKQKTLSLEDVMPFMGKSLFVVSNDTGIRNMAISIGRATLGIFFATVPFRYWPRSKYHDVAFRHDRSEPSVEEVLALADQMIERTLRK